MKTKHKQNTNTTIREQFASRPWAVNLCVNDEPVNHRRLLPARSRETCVRYYPTRGGAHEHGLDWFIEAVENAAAKSLRGPTVLDIRLVEECDVAVTKWLAILLRTGRAMTWRDGKRLELNQENLIVNLWMTESDRATTVIVERIVGQLNESPPAGHRRGNTKRPAPPALRGGRRARPRTKHAGSEH